VQRNINSFAEKGENYHVLDDNATHFHIEHMLVCSTNLVTFCLDKHSPLLNGQFIVIALKGFGPNMSMLLEEVMDFLPICCPIVIHASHSILSLSCVYALVFLLWRFI
jgi:hypothetical protein